MSATQPMIRLFSLAAIVLLLFSRPALAQPSVMDIPGPFGVPVASAGVEKYAAILELDRDQKALLRTLYQGYRGAYREAVVSSDKELEELNKDQDKPRMNQGMQALQRFAEKARKVEDQFFEDIAAILTPEQAPRLERVKMVRRRDVQMKFAFVAGEGVNLLDLLDHAKAPRTPELNALRQEYETELDRLMVEKVRVMKVSLAKADKIQQNQLPDFTVVGEIIGDLYAIGGRIRDLNRRYLREAGPLLPESMRDGLNLEFKKRSFPRVYKPTLAQKCLSMTKDLEGLTPEQAADIKTISAGFEHDLEPVNQRYAAAIESTQERFPKDFLIIMQSRFDPNNKEDPLVKARAEREELDQKTLTRLRGVLKADQFQKLPQYDDEIDKMPDFLPNLNARNDWNKWQSEQSE